MDMENLGYSLRLPEGNIYDAPCPLLRTLSVIGGKWKLPLLWHIADYTEAGSGVRYNALKRAVHGITNTMLNKCLTERGRALLPALRELYVWGQGLPEKTSGE